MTPLEELRLSCDIHNFGGQENYNKFVPILNELSQEMANIPGEVFDTEEEFYEFIANILSKNGIGKNEGLMYLPAIEGALNIHYVVQNSLKKWKLNEEGERIQQCHLST